VVAPSALWAAAAYTTAALSICGIFPTVMALALEGRTHDTGSTAALITGAASLGGLVWPWLVGAIAQEVGLRAAMATAAAPLLPMLLLAQAVRHAPHRVGPVLAPPVGT
jgi:fucose permease